MIIKQIIAIIILIVPIVALIILIKSNYWKPLLENLKSALSENNNKWSITRIVYLLQVLVVIAIVYILFGVVTLLDNLPQLSIEHVTLLLGLSGVAGATKVLNKKFEKKE